MATSEAERFEFRDRLIEKLGEDVATRLMECLPPFSWTEIATKDDLNALKEWTGARFDNLEASIDTRFAGVSAEFVALEGRLSLQIAGLSEKMAEQSEKIAGLSEKMTAQSAEQSEKIAGLSEKIAGLSEKMTAQTRTLVFAFAGFAATICGAMTGGILFA